ncbi:DEHA2E13354p [Debaryomyces hansenii CBS767]|jgi:hypothetical protein|uniref:rRNA-processing protein FYV7 n=1 Tax=Debaryomyces hansenii (strain ATCC 36239 / CBS 767 / BCRC 21394 / JCM 1990 / NBRC 0083 / IGC 2968) TaxID=284592 RepID=FYV7_DEBHA|nr:DEHA2E13354p [Debaryomyces hansenii CBS767]Q6BPI5.2 RecName: Full=rRNA-processing protein FYV7 [Debaryomyces hansenii CBS767]CAG88126.2 DEHA2E13354p [Debaryomyces hansenii CBS767]|eukprot:XP_459885.2 DEHA2E13354p [Debaryomyces hansenii CBS767]
MGDKKQFRGKNPYTDRREFKSKEIKKSLVHRARLRKNYFKLLEKEGINHEPEQNGDESAESQNKSEEFKRSHIPDSRNQPSKRPMNFAERAKIAKERKEHSRQAKLKSIQDRRETIEKKSKERERRKDNLSKKTKSGQPLMGPRINNLLDKIKKDIE